MLKGQPRRADQTAHMGGGARAGREPEASAAFAIRDQPRDRQRRPALRIVQRPCFAQNELRPESGPVKGRNRAREGVGDVGESCGARRDAHAPIIRRGSAGQPEQILDHGKRHRIPVGDSRLRPEERSASLDL